MSSNLKVNSLVPATGTEIGIGTTGGSIDFRCPATFGGNVTIGGTLTYNEVINIDSIGVITARSNIDCNGSLDVDGHTDLDNVSIAGVTTITRTGGNGLLKVERASGAGLHIQAQTALGVFGTTSNHNLRLISNGNERILLSTNGNIGINDSSPDTRLSVTAASGTDVVGKFTSTDARAWIQLRDNSTTDTGVMLGAEGDDMLLRAGSNTRLRILSTGQVLIGATSGGNPDTDDLIVSGSGKRGITVCSTDGSETRLVFADALSSTGAVIGQVLYDHSVDRMDFYTGATRKVSIDSSGRLLLGTTAASNAESFRIHTSNSGKAIIKLTNSTTGSGTGDGFEFGMNGNEQIEFVNKENTDMFFATNNTERLRIDSYGALLVGTTAPLYTGGDVRHEIRKDVARAYSPTNMVAHSHLLINNSNTGSARFSSIGFRSGTGDGAIGFVYKDSANDADFVVVTDGAANGTERVRIKNNGYMGVGTNNPTFMIHTQGSGNNGGVRLENSHTITTVSGNTAAGAFPHNLILSNYGGSGTADNRMVSLGFDIPTTVSHANAQIVYQATGSNGVGDLQFWLENGNTSYERARITAAGQFLVGATSSAGARAIIQQNSSDTNPLDQATSADSSGLRIQNYSFGVGRYSALSLECANSSSVQSASIIAQSTSSGQSPDIIIANRTSNSANTERMRIDKSGYVTKVSQPRALVKIYSNTTIANGKVTNWATPTFNVGSLWDTTNKRFVAPVTGLYLLGGNFRIGAPGKVRVTRFVIKAYNTSNVQMAGYGGGVGGGNNYDGGSSGYDHPYVSFTNAIYLQTGQYLELHLEEVATEHTSYIQVSNEQSALWCVLLQ